MTAASFAEARRSYKRLVSRQRITPMERLDALAQTTDVEMEVVGFHQVEHRRPGFGIDDSESALRHVGKFLTQ